MIQFESKDLYNKYTEQRNNSAEAIKRQEKCFEFEQFLISAKWILVVGVCVSQSK